MEIANKKVSFDFDGVMHKSVIEGTIHPIHIWAHKSLEPFHEMHDALKEESKTNKIIIVTKRDQAHINVILDFLEMHGLEVEQVICTNNKEKLPYLLELNVSKHYDDEISIGKDLEANGIEFIPVYPFK